MTKKKIKKSSKKSQTKRFSPRQQQVIRELADMLGKILPATSRGDFALQKIAKDRGLAMYFDEKLTSKLKQFIFFITQVHKNHPRTLKSIINDILADAIQKWRENGVPVLRAEADALKAKLFEFGIDLVAEIDELELPVDRPKITPPPAVIQQSLEKFGLNRGFRAKVLPMFKDGHVNEAVHKAGEILESVVMRASGIQGKYGRDLMAHAFSKDNPVIDVSAYHGGEITDPMDEKEGFTLAIEAVENKCGTETGVRVFSDPHYLSKDVTEPLVRGFRFRSGIRALSDGVLILWGIICVGSLAWGAYVAGQAIQRM